MTQIEDGPTLEQLARICRMAQKRHFADRSREILIIAKAAESLLDKALLALERAAPAAHLDVSALPAVSATVSDKKAFARLDTIPVSAATRIVDSFQVGQVVIYARRTGDAPRGREFIVTDGVGPEHQTIAAKIGLKLGELIGGKWS